MKIIECQQGSVEWFQARSSIPTASEMDNLVSDTGEVRTGKMVESYLAQKLAEWWLGGPLPAFNTFDVEMGSLMENEARPWLSLTYDKTIRQVGFITTDDGKVGCSPDGLFDDDTGAEIKCPTVHVHTSYLLKGVVPPQYRVQIQTGMFVTGASHWTFVSYNRRFPALVLRVERDKAYQEAITDALAKFLAKFEAGKKRLIELNDGKEPKRYELKPQPQPEEEPVGITP